MKPHMEQDWVCSRVIKKQIQSQHTVCVVVVVVIIILEFLSFTGFPGRFYTECVTYRSDTTKLGEEVSMWGNSAINGELLKMRNASSMYIAPKEKQSRNK